MYSIGEQILIYFSFCGGVAIMIALLEHLFRRKEDIL